MCEPRKIRTLVCDDEPEAREGVVRLLRRDSEITLVGEAHNGNEAAAEISRLSPDLVFLDVQMPKLDGVGVISTIARSQLSPVVVFVSAYDTYALRAFEVQALDYLLKPFSDARFFKALSAAKVRVRERRPGRHYIEHVMVRLGAKLTVVRVEDIDWVEADDYYARLHVPGRSYLIRQTMEQLETSLDPRDFVRVHRSTIVRIDRVHSLEPSLSGSQILTLRDGTRVTLSRARRVAFEAAIGGKV